ncbi:MAG: hydrazine synthase subunit beta [Candidatus Anammoxibacter sp.]
MKISKKFISMFLGVAVFAIFASSIAQAGFIQGTHIKTEHPSPFYILVSHDGKTLFTANQSGHSVSIIDAKSRKVIGVVPVGDQPEALALTQDGKTLYVCNAESDSVSVIDVAKKSVTKVIKVGDWPCNIKLSKDGSKAYVCCSGSMWDKIDIIDTSTNEKTGEIQLSHYGPRDIAISPDGKTGIVILDTAGLTNRSVDFVDLTTDKVFENRIIRESCNLRGITYTPDGNYVIVTYETAKTWLPVCEAENGQIFTNNIAVIETKPGGKIARLPLDELNEYDGNPYGIAIDPAGKYVYIGIRGMHRVSILDLEKIIEVVTTNSQDELDYLRDDFELTTHYLVQRVNVGLGPSSVALSPDGKICYAANYFSNSISIIKTPN